MNYTETFNDFATKLGPTDLALYAGAAIVIYVLFKDKLNPVQKFVGEILTKLNLWKNKAVGSNPVVVSSQNDTFHSLIASWKQTRDLAVAGGCSEAVKVIDQAFPHLSPNACNKEVKVS